MPMSAASLKSKIQAQVVSQFGSPDDAAVLAKWAQAVADAVIEEIAANGTVTVVVTNVTGVTTGPGVSGPGTGIGTIDTV